MLITEKIIRQSFRYEERNGFEANVLWMGKPLWDDLVRELERHGLLKRAYGKEVKHGFPEKFYGMEVRFLFGAGKVFYLGTSELHRYRPRSA